MSCYAFNHNSFAYLTILKFNYDALDAIHEDSNLSDSSYQLFAPKHYAIGCSKTFKCSMNYHGKQVKFFGACATGPVGGEYTPSRAELQKTFEVGFPSSRKYGDLIGVNMD